MNTEDINIFLSICRCGNISKAANELFLSQSSISYKLSILENELGTKLFLRQKGLSKLSLTPAGEQFLPIAHEIYDLYTEALHVGEEKTRIRLMVAGVDSVNSYFLTEFYQKFICENTDIQLTVINEYTNNILNKVKDSIYDIGISNDYYNLNTIHSYALFKEQFVCLKRCKDNEKTDDMDIISLDTLDSKCEIFQGFDAAFIQWHKNTFSQLCPKFTTEIIRMGVKLMTSPGDWMIMPYTAARYYHDSQPFQIYKLPSPPPPRTVYITTNTKQNAHNSNAILQFKEAMNAYIEKRCILAAHHMLQGGGNMLEKQ